MMDPKFSDANLHQTKPIPPEALRNTQSPAALHWTENKLSWW